MSIKSTVASAVAAAAVFGGVGVAAAAGGSAPRPTLTSAPAATTAAAPATSAAPAASPPAECRGDDGSWPAFTNGRPAGFDAGDQAGVYLWHDQDGWHLRVTHLGDGRQVYTGTITTRGTFDAERVADERNDIVRVGPEGHTLYFRFVNYGHIDGVDFTTHCAPALNVNLKGDGQELQTSEVRIGHDDTNPTSVPFVIQRAE